MTPKPGPVNTARQALIDLLSPELPKAWEWRKGESRPGVIDTPYVFLSLKTIEREPSAPLAAHLLTFTLTLVAPGDDLDRAEEKLGDDLEQLLFRIDAIPAPLKWLKADKVLFESKWLSYEIDLTLIIQKLTETEAI